VTGVHLAVALVYKSHYKEACSRPCCWF